MGTKIAQFDPVAIGGEIEGLDTVGNSTFFIAYTASANFTPNLFVKAKAGVAPSGGGHVAGVDWGCSVTKSVAVTAGFEVLQNNVLENGVGTPGDKIMFTSVSLVSRF